MTNTSRRGLGRVLVVLAVVAGLALAAAPASAAVPTIPEARLTVSDTTLVVAQPVTLTLTQPKAPGKPMATGIAAFYAYGEDGRIKELGLAELNSAGAAKYVGPLPFTGSGGVLAFYAGDDTYPGGYRPAQPVTVAQASTTTTVASTKTTVPKGKTATFAAMVIRGDAWKGSLVGTTRFVATAPGRATVTLDRPTTLGGSAVWTPALPEGRWSVTAQYLGNDSWTGSTSAPVEQVVGTAPNQAPTAVAAASPTTGTAPLAVSFSSAGSTDPDGTIVAYAWEFGDGDFSVEANPSHTYAAGTYTATLAVTDNSGATRTATVTVTAEAAPVVSTIDQSNPRAGRISGYTRGAGTSLGQGFTAGRSGTLDKVTIGVQGAGVTLAVSLRVGSVTGTEVGSGQGVTVDGASTLDIVLAQPAEVTAGTPYVMVVTPTDGSATFIMTTDNMYPGPQYETYAGYWYDAGSTDMTFATWVR